MPLISLRQHSRADLIGMLLSFACMLHCLLLPGLIAVGIGGLLMDVDSEWTHVIMLAIVLPISGLALVGGWVRHRRANVVVLGLAGLVLLALAAFLVHDQFGRTADALVTTLGGALLALAHWRNRDCSCPHSGRKLPRSGDAPLRPAS